ncbi:USP24 [Branchiostoma lanceolatum]|uniref:ubiquitinyl hydrolase 1 n=1 Tax=Branchiostoma lanceolatum TaxID=7740 RepID=A0A8J9YWL8_BRALA|nr:USP24 [Branchiostoma lanceolatum]
MDVDEQHVQTLLAMGFPDVAAIRKALRLGKNDVNEAVAILTSEQPGADFESVEMTDVSGQTADQAPPSYDEVSSREQGEGEGENLEFPAGNLYELESRTFTNSWSIPYRRHESLGRCLLAATRLAKEGLAEADENCRRFMDGVLPDAFNKLLTSSYVTTWKGEIQEGIYTMSQFLVDLVAARLKHPPLPVNQLYLLSTVFDPDVNFHVKNRSRPAERLHWDTVFGEGKTYAISPAYATGCDPCGWLVNLVNRWGEKGGFEQLFGDESQVLCWSEEELAAALRPVACAAPYLNHNVLQPLLKPPMELAHTKLQSLLTDDLRSKDLGGSWSLLMCMRQLVYHLWTDQVEAVNQLTLKVLITCLKSQHYGPKMAALRQLGELIEQSSGNNGRAGLDQKHLLCWLQENSVLKYALEGSIHQAQYADRVKKLLQFLAPNLAKKEISNIWKMQENQPIVVAENIHGLLVHAAEQFDEEQLEHLFRLIQTSWSNSTHATQELLLQLMGQLACSTQQSGIIHHVLSMLWDMAHLPALPRPLLHQALNQHSTILFNTSQITTATRKEWVLQCVHEVKSARFVVPALQHIMNILRNMLSNMPQKLMRSFIQDMNRTQDLVKVLVTSLITIHKTAKSSTENMQAPALVDDKFGLDECVQTHLSMIGVILEDGELFLPWHRLRDLWDCLVSGPTASEEEREMCWRWLQGRLNDLEPEPQMNLLKERLFKVPPTQLTTTGFQCFQSFFESVNEEQHGLRKLVSILQVEKSELLGLDYVWRVALESVQDEVADLAISMLIRYSYTNLAPKLKKEPLTVHKKYFEECQKRLLAAQTVLGESAIAKAVTSATTALTANTVPQMASDPSMARMVQLRAVERILLIVHRYISTVEDQQCVSRTLLSHGAAFRGQPLSLHVSCETSNRIFDIKGHSNERLGSIRHKIAVEVNHPPDYVQIAVNERTLLWGKDQKLIHQLSFEDGMTLSVKMLPCGTPALDSWRTRGKQAMVSTPHYTSDQEKQLPSMVLSGQAGIYELLYNTAELEGASIQECVYQLLLLLPTDPTVQSALDSLSEQPVKEENRAVLSAALELLMGQKAPKVSPLRLVYNLQALSGHVMPVDEDEGLSAILHVQQFCQNFLRGGGLDFLFCLLSKEGLDGDMVIQARRGCLSTCLQLTRFLLGGKPLREVSSESVGGATPVKLRRQSASTPEQEAMSPGASSPGAMAMSPVATDSEGEGAYTAAWKEASRQVLDMTEEGFRELLQCLVGLAWAAAAGRLDLAPYAPAATQGTPGRKRSGGLSHVSICTGDQVSSQDATIAAAAMDLLVTCLHLRTQDLDKFYTWEFLQDFIVDVLLASASPKVREAATHSFYSLSKIRSSVEQDDNSTSNPQQFLLRSLQQAHVPLWTSSSYVRTAAFRLLCQSEHYFRLVCKLVQGMDSDDLHGIGLNTSSLLQSELDWLNNFEPTESDDHAEADDVLLTGHLRLIKTLCQKPGVDRADIGFSLNRLLLQQLLFPAAHRGTAAQTAAQGTAKEQDSSLKSKCHSDSCRQVAYDLLVILCEGCSQNLQDVTSQLVNMHHQPQLTHKREWEHLPLVDGRASCGHVGLKNGGATCYMNSVLQQLFMTPGIPEQLLGVESSSQSASSDGILHEVQRIMAHLQGSMVQYYTPEHFWNSFKLWGETINVREHQDAFEFLTNLTDQVDTVLKKLSKQELFKSKFQGVFSDQQICIECPHRYEQEEEFMALNVTVKQPTLEQSLEQFVRGEILEGENAYLCEKCNEKRSAVKRMCLKRLPPHLAIQLKRFDYDWEANRALKFDDYFRFPRELDVAPYTVEGVEQATRQGCTEPTSPGSPAKQTTLYRLVGVVVHSGQANAGHYYAFIQDRRPGRQGHWLKFNDTTVEEVELTDQLLEEECFGGTFQVSSTATSTSSSFPETRVRYWSAYLLFYERQDGRPAVPKSPSSKDVRKPNGRSLPRGDSLSQLAALIQAGEQQGLFQSSMPPDLQQEVHAQNLRFMLNKDIYSTQYFSFIKRLVCCPLQGDVVTEAELVAGTKLALHFLCNTYFTTKGALRTEVHSWVECVKQLLQASSQACTFLVNFVSQQEGTLYIRPLLLECPTREVRITFASLIHAVLEVCLKRNISLCDSLLQLLLSMVNQYVASNLRNSDAFFSLFHEYGRLGISACEHLLQQNMFSCLLGLLLTGPQIQQSTTGSKWTPGEIPELLPLHLALATTVLHCDVSYARSDDPGDTLPPRPTSIVAPEQYIKAPIAVQACVSGEQVKAYVNEVVWVFTQGSTPPSTMVEMLLHCCYCNRHFSLLLLDHLKQYLRTTATSELRGLLTTLQEVLMLEDPLQTARLDTVIKGTNNDGLIGLMRGSHTSDSTRTYQCVKFLVHLANKSHPAKEFLLEVSSGWKWAVSWLQKKMQEHQYRPQQSNVSNELSSSRSFQRTMSAQSTLAEATALLSELQPDGVSQVEDQLDLD